MRSAENRIPSHPAFSAASKTWVANAQAQSKSVKRTHAYMPKPGVELSRTYPKRGGPYVALARS